MKKFWKTLGKILLVMLLIPLVLVAAILVIGKVSDHAGQVSWLSGGSAAVSDTLAESWKNIPSDIEGMTKWDKYAAGLSVADGSDTDGDGLTDKEELEVYKTDPLKVSSSGDLYSDLYKVENGMDPTARYDYTGEISFAHNTCPEVRLTAESPTDFNAVVSACGIEELSGQKVYAAYDVYNYGSVFTVDLQDVLRREGLTTGEISVYVSNGTEPQPYSFKADGTVITLRRSFSTGSAYRVYITEKNFLSFAAAAVGIDEELWSLPSLNDTPEEVTGSGLIMVSPLLTEFLRKPIVVYTEPLLTPAATQALQDKITAYNNELFGTGYPYDIQTKSSVEIKLIYNFLKSAVSFMDITGIPDSQISWQHLLFLYYSYEDRVGASAQWGTGTDEEEQGSGPVRNGDPVTGFDPALDTLPFGNFKTALSPNGSCAGISHLTAYLYNQGGYPSRCDGGNGTGIIWDLGLDTENLTLCEPGLGDYKDENFILEHSSDGQTLSENLSAGEEEFLKMIASAYLEGNANAEFICYDLLGGDFSTAPQDYAVIEGAIAYLESGKILDVYLDMVDGTRHAVNVVGYRRDEANPDVVWFTVYDSNFPRNDAGSQVLSDAGFTLRVEKRLKASGDGFTFAFDYFPFTDRSYGATSNREIAENNLILILDEFGHLIND